MAVMSEADRAAVWARWMRENIDACGVTKTELRAAVDALDSFLDINATAINNAIPQPARGALSTSQKARLLAYITLRRWGG